MIGFHPVVMLTALLLATFGPGLIVAILLLAIARQWVLSGLLSLSLVLGLIFLFHVSPKIELWAWGRSIRLNAEANRRALEAASPLASLPEDPSQPEDDSMIWRDADLTPIPGFKWYLQPHIAAADGVFRGFSVEGIPHVRVQRIRHGWRGISRGTPPLIRGLPLHYAPTSHPEWFIWTCGVSQPQANP